MKKGFALAFIFAMTMLLAACSITVNGDLPEGLRISNATYGTDYQATIDGTSQSVICNDRTTNFTYAFTFDGDLQSWKSYLKGERTGDVAGEVTLDLNDRRVSYDRSTNRVTVNYQILAGAAPQAIVPTPKVAGKSQLFLQFGTYNYQLLSNPVSILQSCN